MADDDPITIYDLQRSGAIRRVPDGFWRDPTNARAVLEELWRREGITAETAPMVCRNAWYENRRLTTMLRLYRWSPSLLLMSLYPGRYRSVDFPEFPKAADLQRSAFVESGMEWSDNSMRRWHLAQVQRHDRQGLCRKCLAPRLPDSKYCDAHRQWARAWQKRLRSRLKAHRDQQAATGKCIWYGCRNPPEDARLHCAKHLAMRRLYVRRHRRKQA